MERYKNKNWLEEQYHEQDKTQSEIADICNVDQGTVSRWLGRHGLRKDKSTEKECPGCGNTFRTAKSDDHEHCSRECRYNGDRVEVTCPTCGDSFTRPSCYVEKYDEIHCSVSCMADSYSLPRKLREKYSYGRKWERARKEALDRDGWQCQSCGMSNDVSEEVFGCGLHVHHKIPYREFDSEEEAHKLENLVTLCPSCHTSEEMSDS